MKEREEKHLSVRAQCLPGAIPLFGAWVLLVIALVNIYRLGRRKYTFLFYLCWCVPAFLFYAAAALAVCLSKISAAEQPAAFLLMVLGVFCAASWILACVGLWLELLFLRRLQARAERVRAAELL